MPMPEPDAIYSWHLQPIPQDRMRETMLETLSEGCNIVAFTKTDEGVMVVEQCDEYHGCTLSLDQVRQLIKELEALIGAEEPRLSTTCPMCGWKEGGC